MPPVKIKCLVCNEIVRGTSGKDVFQKGQLGLQPLKERLQVVLQVNLDRKSSHSTLLCSSCVKQLDKIDDYQCNIEAFSDTFRDAVESRQAKEKDHEDSTEAEAEAEKERLCFVCNGGLTGSDGNGVVVGSDDQPSNSLKTRLERTLSVNLDKELASLGRAMELCGQCTGTLGRIEKELKVVTDFASTYRSTRVLYDDDIDQDIAEAVEEDDDDDEELEASTVMEEADDYDEDMDERWVYGERPKRKGTVRSQPIPGITFSDEGFSDADKYLDRSGKQARCKICNYSTPGVCHVRTHIRRHLGLKPYSCEYCGHAFADRSNCIKHIRRCARPGKMRKGQSQLAQIASGFHDPEQNPSGSLSGTGVGLTGTDSQNMNRTLNSDDVVEVETEGEYGCSKCTASFHTVKEANAHMKLHKQRKCSTADSSASDSGVSSKGNITENTSPATSSQHSLPSRMADRIQESRFTARALEKRRRIDGHSLECQSDDLVEQLASQEYICTACNYTHSSHSRVLAHARTHTGEKPFQCHLCDRAYVDNSSYLRHMKEHREKGGNSKEGPKTSKAGAEVNSDNSSGGLDGEQDTVTLSNNPKPFECSLCNETFDNPARLTEHIRSHIEETDKQVGIQKRMQDCSIPPQASVSGEREQQPTLPTSSASLYPSIRIKTEPLSEDYTTDPFNDRMKHDSTHQNQLSYEDSNSSYYQRQSSSSVDFDDFDHNGAVNDTDAMAEAYSNMSEVPLANQFDDASDPTAVSQEFRDAHIKWDATSSVYKCVKCSYENHTLYNIHKHIRVHTGEKPYKCELCTKRFSDKSNRIKHVRKYHQQEPTPRPNKVAKPDNVSTVEVRPQLASDAKPFKCDVCKVSFRYESTLKKHQELHIANQIFVCPICSSKFSCLIDLQKHKAAVHPPKTDVHSLPQLPKKVSPFKCPACGVIFALSVELDRHYAKEHSGRSDVNQTSNHAPLKNNNLQNQNSQGVHQKQSGGSPTDLWTSEPNAVAFRSSIEQLDNGLYRCILCCKKESPHLSEVFEHQRNRHEEAELVTYENMVNSGKISLIVDIPGGHRCKICPFKSSLLSKMHYHIKWQHYVNFHNATATAELPEDNLDQSLIMKKHPQSFYYECLYCHVRHKAPKMLAKHVKNKHPQEYLAAVKRKEQNGVSAQSPNNVARSDTRQTEVANPSASAQQQQSRKRSSSQSPHSLGSAKAMKTHANPSTNDRMPFRCSMCAHMFEEPGDLQVHFGDHCPGQVYPFTSSLRMQVMGLGIMQYFPCDLCGATYIKPANLQRHLDNHAMNLVPVHGKPYQKNPYMQGMPQPHSINSPIPHGIGGLSCPLCGMQFVDPQKLMHHFELHQQQGHLPHGSGYQQQMPFGHNSLPPPYASPGLSHMHMSPNPFTAEAIAHRQQTDALSSVLFQEKKNKKTPTSNQFNPKGSTSPRSKIPPMQLPAMRNVHSMSSEPPPSQSHYHTLHNQESNSSPAPQRQSKEEFNNLRKLIAEPTPITICPRDDYLEDPPMTASAHETRKLSTSREPNSEDRSQHTDKSQKGCTNLLTHIKSEHAKRDETNKYTALKDQDTASETLTCESVQDAMFSDSDDWPPVGDKLTALKTEKLNEQGNPQLNEQRNPQSHDRLLQFKKEKLQDMSAKVKQSMAAILAERKKDSEKPVSHTLEKSPPNSEMVPKNTALSQMFNCIERLQKEPVTSVASIESKLHGTDSGRNLIMEILKESDSAEKSQGNELKQTVEQSATNVSNNNVAGNITDGVANADSQEPNTSTSKGIESSEDSANYPTTAPTAQSEKESKELDEANLMIRNVVSLTIDAEYSKQLEPRKESAVPDTSSANNVAEVDGINHGNNREEPACQESDSSKLIASKDKVADMQYQISGTMSSSTELISQGEASSDQAVQGEVDQDTSIEILNKDAKVVSGVSLISAIAENSLDAEADGFSDLDLGASDGDYDDDFIDDRILYEPIALSPDASASPSFEQSISKLLSTDSKAKETIEQKEAECLQKDAEDAQQDNSVSKEANSEKDPKESFSMEVSIQDSSEAVFSEDQIKTNLTKDESADTKIEQLGILTEQAVCAAHEKDTSSPDIAAIDARMAMKSVSLSVELTEGLPSEGVLCSKTQKVSTEQKGPSIVRPWLTADDTDRTKEIIEPDSNASKHPGSAVTEKTVTADSQISEVLNEISKSTSAMDVVKHQESIRDDTKPPYENAMEANASDTKSIELSEGNQDAIIDTFQSSKPEITDDAQGETVGAHTENNESKKRNTSDDIVPNNTTAKLLAAHITVDDTEWVVESAHSFNDLMSSSNQKTNENSNVESVKDSLNAERGVSSIFVTPCMDSLVTACDTHSEESTVTTACIAADIAQSPKDDTADKVTASLNNESSEKTARLSQLSAEDYATPESMSAHDKIQTSSEATKMPSKTEGTNEIVEKTCSAENEGLVISSNTVPEVPIELSNVRASSTKDTPSMSPQTTDTYTSSDSFPPMNLGENDPSSFTATNDSALFTTEENLVVGLSISKPCSPKNTNNENSVSQGACISKNPTSNPPVERDEKQSKEIVCSLCFCRYQNKTVYLEHLLTHTKVHCPSCSETFSDIQDLYVHFKNVH